MNEPHLLFCDASRVHHSTFDRCGNSGSTLFRVRRTNLRRHWQAVNGASILHPRPRKARHTRSDG